MPRKLIESTFVTLDGVIENPQDWSAPYWDEEHLAHSQMLLDRADALVLGRATFEVFASYWPAQSGDPYADKLNAMPKHVASRTLDRADWNATVLEGDAAAAVAALKDGPGDELLKFGTGELDRALLAQGVIDELHLWVLPVMVGSGRRLLDDIETMHLDLVDLTRFESGVVVLTLVP